MLKLLTLKEVVAEVGASANTIRAWIAAGEFPDPVYTPSGEKRWHEVDVQRWYWSLKKTPPQNPVKRKTEAPTRSPTLPEAQSKKKPESA